MNLYLLKRREERTKELPNYDAAHGFVIRAESERFARQLAASHCGDEGPNVWWGEAFTECKLLAEAVPGRAEIVLRDFNAG